MWLFFRRRIASVKRVMGSLILNRKKGGCAPLVNLINDTKKTNASDETQVLIRKCTSDQLFTRYPIDLCRDRNFLTVFSPLNVETIAVYAQYQQKQITVLKAIRFEGFNYSGNQEVAVFSNAITRQQLTINMEYANNNKSLTPLLQPSDALYLKSLNMGSASEK